MQEYMKYIVVFVISFVIVFAVLYKFSGTKDIANKPVEENTDKQSTSAQENVAETTQTAQDTTSKPDAGVDQVSQPAERGQIGDFPELKIETLREGEGEGAANGDTVTVHYVGTLRDGTKFDSSYDRGTPFSFVLGQGKVIAGWEQGILGMKKNEKRRLEIPSSMGYGEYGAGGVIPPNAGLIFEVELLDIAHPAPAE